MSISDPECTDHSYIHGKCMYEITNDLSRLLSSWNLKISSPPYIMKFFNVAPTPIFTWRRCAWTGPTFETSAGNLMLCQHDFKWCRYICCFSVYQHLLTQFKRCLKLLRGIKGNWGKWANLVPSHGLCKVVKKRAICITISIDKKWAIFKYMSSKTAVTLLENPKL